MQCACAILSYVSCPPLEHVSTLSHKRHDFWEKKIIEYEMCVFFKFSLQVLSETFLLSRRTERDVAKHLCWSPCEVTVMLVSFQRVLKISRQIFEKYSNIKFHENPPLGAEWQTDRHRPPRHRFFLVSLCLKANAEMVPNIPSCHYMLLM